MDPLALLSDLLRQQNAQSAVSMRPCTEIDEVHSDLEKRARSGRPNYEPQDLQAEAVKKFWGNGKFESLREARLVSFGLAVRPWNDRRCLMEEPEHFGAALTGLVEWEDSPRQFRKCYQGLVRSYFDYDGLGREAPAVGQKNWRRLQTYLCEKAKLIQDATINPDWVGCVMENKGLFSESPCTAYAQDLLDGREDKVNRVRQNLGISDASWFTRELVLSQIAQACRLDHLTFSKLVERLLALLGGKEVLWDRGLRMILDRYAQLPQTPKHPGLKDYSVNAWGNPWEDRWGGVTNEARQMVEDWLKSELIELFFTKLAKDTKESEKQERASKERTIRRVEFWKQYVPSIKKIHFALGPHARNSREPDFVELRKKLNGLMVALEDKNPLNNAFVMTFRGDLVAVEFSGESNAFYGYSVKRNLPFDLKNPVRSAPVNGKNSLKNSSRVLYLRHQDNIKEYSDWETRFKADLQDKFGLVPGRPQVRRGMAHQAVLFPESHIQRPPAAPPPNQQTSAPEQPSSSQKNSSQSRGVSRTPAPTTRLPVPQEAPLPPPEASLPTPVSAVYSEENLKQLASRFNATVVDRREKGGALWVVMGDAPDALKILKSWGFRYSEGKGWWKKDAG